MRSDDLALSSLPLLEWLWDRRLLTGEVLDALDDLGVRQHDEPAGVRVDRDNPDATAERLCRAGRPASPPEHTYLPPAPLDEDVPAAQRVDTYRRDIERAAPTRINKLERDLHAAAPHGRQRHGGGGLYLSDLREDERAAIVAAHDARIIARKDGEP